MALVVSFVKLRHFGEKTDPHLRIYSESGSLVSLADKMLRQTGASRWYIMNDSNSITLRGQLTIIAFYLYCLSNPLGGIDADGYFKSLKLNPNQSYRNLFCKK